jgi:hypothetical protein
MHEDIAADRLRAALANQEHQTARYEQAIGTSAEISAFARLQAANLEVANCDRITRRFSNGDLADAP